MLHAGLGLSAVRTKDLRTLLKAVHTGSIETPLTLPELARHGLQHCAEDLDLLRGLDAAGVRVAVVAAVAERRAATERRMQPLRLPDEDR